LAGEPNKLIGYYLDQIARSGTERGAAPGNDCSSEFLAFDREHRPSTLLRAMGWRWHSHWEQTNDWLSHRLRAPAGCFATESGTVESRAVDANSTVLLIQCSTVLRRSRCGLSASIEKHNTLPLSTTAPKIKDAPSGQIRRKSFIFMLSGCGDRPMCNWPRIFRWPNDLNDVR
jgi:hypothetical protein